MATQQIKVLPHQLEFIKDTQTKFLALCAGFGSGKTRALILKTIDLAALNTGTDAGLFSATHELATDILLPEMDARLEELNIHYTYKASPRPVYSLHFPHGSTRILVRSFENWQRIIGNNYSFACVDEIDTLKPAIAKKSWQKLMGRIRVGKVNQVAAASTPEGFRFMYDFWVKDAVEKDGSPKTDRRIIRARSLDNPFLPEGFIQDLYNNYSPQMVNAYVNGQFTNLQQGTVYSNFERKLNVCADRVEVRDRLHIGVDFNVGKMAGVVHVLRDGLPRAVDEFTGYWDTPDLIDAIKHRYPKHAEAGLINIYPDASGASRKSTNAATSDIILLKQARFLVFAKDSNPAVRDRVNGMNAMFLNANGERRYLVNPVACPKYVEALEQQPYTESGEPDKTLGYDHLTDAGSYAISYLFPIAATRQAVTQTRVSYS